MYKQGSDSERDIQPIWCPIRSLFLPQRAPISIYTFEQERRRATIPTDPWQYRIQAWFTYHMIQIRWGIERGIARLLHKRWGAH
ncbi:hypothetical protein KSD_31990 [Ktedonobacter sp. SOSP1-85]|uniref:hypothetical protein n=1 Tax=Ktedonobacter sp. SOSP1-85 TaxID=2778367 RepID=UPI001916B6F3|nr:hypothetical protein [Ktedonobacter sp. SOSP1-85]GHO75428.1 hypothetical protein KSD_31990 [Ktedonobacter sp. SOSP1-85]